MLIVISSEFLTHYLIIKRLQKYMAIFHNLVGILIF